MFRCWPSGLGRSHELAVALWDTGWYEARLLASFVDEPERVFKRAAFALIASLAVHDKKAADEPFTKSLLLIERAAIDERNFVRKAVNWALRAVGRRNAALNTAAAAVARRLAASAQATTRWVGKDALRELTDPAATKRLAKRNSNGGQRVRGKRK